MSELQKTEVTNMSDSLEQIVLKLDSLSGLVKVCAATFEHDNAFSFVNENDVLHAFHNVGSQIEEIAEELEGVVYAAMAEKES